MLKSKFATKKDHYTEFSKNMDPRIGERIYFVSSDGTVTLAPKTESFVGLSMPTMKFPVVSEKEEIALIKAAVKDFLEYSNSAHIATAKITSDDSVAYVTFGIIYDDDSASASYKDVEYMNLSIEMESELLTQKDDTNFCDEIDDSQNNSYTLTKLTLAAAAVATVAVTASIIKKIVKR